MHILVTNDDGPPSAHASPYVHCLVRQLQAAGHTVSVCLPDAQRSWIGKAHMIGQTVKPTYYRPSKTSWVEAPPSEQTPGLEEQEGTRHEVPSPPGTEEEWVLVNGTPASCVQVGLRSYFHERGPVDLVVSGPNYGRNTTAVFALSSGTLGAALEAAVCRVRSIALSYAFFSRNHDPVIIREATAHSVRVIQALWDQWPAGGDELDLYSVNVPLVEGVSGNKTVFTAMMQNYWGEGGCFEEIDAEADADANLEEERIREQQIDGASAAKDGAAAAAAASGNPHATKHAHKHFKWSPNFAGVYKSVEASGPGNDGWTVRQGQTR